MIPNLEYLKTPVFVTGVLFLLLVRCAAVAQETVIQSDLEHKVNLYNVNGKPFVNANLDVAGSPFFLSAWKYGVVEINDHSIFRNVQLRLDLQEQEVHFRKSDNTEMVINAGVVKQVILLDSSGKMPVIYSFQSGFPPIDNQNEYNFYQVISDGKIRFLKSMRKSVYTDKDSFSGETKKEFRLYEDYYLVQGNKMERIKKDKKFFLGFMNDQLDKMTNYVTEHKISFRSLEDIKNLVDYYNGL